jgi:threonyl-tRNA synthetase
MADLAKIRTEGSTYTIEKGTKLSDFASRLKLSHQPLLAKVDGHLVGLQTEVEEDMEIQWLYSDSPEALEILRHSAAHLLAHAVLALFPETQTGVGPAVEDGFYYDFLRDKPFTPEDLSSIEIKMKELARSDIFIRKVVLSKKEALLLFHKRGQELKVELIEEKGEDRVTCYEQDDFIDFCLGPHLSSTKHIKHFKLLSVSGAYWKGDEKGKQLQRIYGTAFFKKEDLADYLSLLEEAKGRDHRKIGPELELFSFHEDLGAGLILWHPKGATVRRLIEEYWYQEHIKDDYDFLYTPHIAKLDVWRRSGHTEFYTAMYPPLQIDEVEYELKPMNCPFHIMVYNSKQRSYRNLPLRWAELGTVYRYERSGVLHGLMRVRGFTQDDAHIFCRQDQLEDEIKRVIALALRILRSFGFREYDVFLSTCPQKYCGMEEDWERATEALRKSMEDVGLDFKVDEGEGVFYGPKIDIKIKDALQRSWQCTTIQLDFNLSERFDLSYVGQDGEAHRPYLIHRAILGSLERFFGILIEHYKGNFPVWLAPVQVMIIPVADRHNDYARSLQRKFKGEGIRPELDLRREKVGYKIRDAEVHKVPMILVVGDKEVKRGTASLRIHTVGDKGEINTDEFLEKIKKMDKARTLSFNP